MTTLIITLAWLLAAAAAVVAGAARGAPVSAPSAGRSADARAEDPTAALEIRVWTAEEYEMHAVEAEVVRAIQVHPTSAAAHALLSHVMVRTFSKDPSDLYVLEQASDLAQQAIDLAPQSDAGYVALANVLDVMGQADRGLALLNDAEKAGLAPSWRFYFTRARLMSDDAKIDKVLGLLDTALAFVDAQPRIVVPYVVALLQSQAQGEELIAQLGQWNDRYPSPLFELTTAITYGELGRYAKASEIYTRLVAGHPAMKEAQVNNAILLYRNLNQPDKAVTLLENVLATHAADLTSGSFAMISAHLGAAQLKRKQLDKADQRFRDAMTKDPGNLAIIDFVTRSYREAGQHERFAALVRKLNDDLPGTGVLHALLGETLSEKLHQHDAALRAYADAITLNPERADFYNGLGLAYYRKKSYPEALKSFGTAIEVDPNDATAHYNEACVLSLMGRVDEAVTSLSEALTLDPRLTQTARSDQDFENIKRTLRFNELTQRTPGAPDDLLGH
jgi:tetratricopeptide (TPR) repeat protein